MTARRPPSSQPSPVASARDEGTNLEAGDDLDEWEEVEEEDEPRGWPLGMLLATTVGVWLGRLFYRLPDNLENLAAAMLALVTAIAAAGLYRRWVRRQFAQARARRLGSRR